MQNAIRTLKNGKNKQKDETQRDKEKTDATLPIHDNVVLVREGGENDGEELVTFSTSTSLRHHVFPHRLILLIGEVLEPTTSLVILTYVLKV